MSAYQFYEFQAIDRLLTQAEMDVMGSISTRAMLTASSATFVYNYKDFPADEEMILAQYYDAMLALTSWGQRRLMFRLPAASLDFDGLSNYAVDGLISIQKQGKYVLLDFCSDSEEPSGEWLEGEGLLSSMVSLRSDILDGDFRALYLVWLAGIDAGIHEMEDLEPPVPQGLQDLGHAHRSLANFFEIDPDLIEAAAAASKLIPARPEFEPSTYLPLLSMAEKDDFLTRLANAEPGLHFIFRKRLQSFADATPASDSQPLRTVENLEQLAQAARDRRMAIEQAEKEKARLAKISKVIKNKDALWREVYGLIQRKKVNDYDSAVVILCSLKEAAEAQGDGAQFHQQLAQICKEFQRLSALIWKMKQAGLMND